MMSTLKMFVKYFTYFVTRSYFFGKKRHLGVSLECFAWGQEKRVWTPCQLIVSGKPENRFVAGPFLGLQVTSSKIFETREENVLFDHSKTPKLEFNFYCSNKTCLHKATCALLLN